jgi:hypothetical protein
VKLPFFRREPVTFRERLLAAIEQGLKAEKVLFVSLGEGFYVHVLPPVYDFLADRQRFEREAGEARQAALGDAPLGRYTLVNFRDVREGRFPYSDDYQAWADKFAIKLTGELGLIFLVREQEVRQVIARECERAGLTCEPHGQWDMRILQETGGPGIHGSPGIPMPGRILYTGDLVYEAIGRAKNLSELVREYLAYNVR